MGETVTRALPLASRTVAGRLKIDQDGQDTAASVARLLTEQVNRLTGEAVSTVFHLDGSITDTYSPSGLVVVTTFGTNGSGENTASAVMGPPVSATKTTTFHADGSIGEVLA